jgi:hypothetical protein
VAGLLGSVAGLLGSGTGVFGCHTCVLSQLSEPFRVTAGQLGLIALFFSSLAALLGVLTAVLGHLASVLSSDTLLLRRPFIHLS